jgi:hypothetical protein
VACRAFGEGRSEQGQGGGGEDGRAEALSGPGDAEYRQRRRQPGQQAGCGEQAEPGQEDAPVAVEVGESAAEQQEAGEDERVGVDGPGQVGGGDVQVLLQGWQCDVDDGNVEHDHELRCAHQRDQGVGR